MGEFDGFKEIYDELDETGKEKLSSLLKRIRSERSGMTREEEINSWSILISVLKNWGKTYDNIDWILGDAGDIKNWIKNLG